MFILTYWEEGRQTQDRSKSYFQEGVILDQTYPDPSMFCMYALAHIDMVFYLL